MNSPPAHSRSIEVLLAEDNDNDVELTRIGFRESRLKIELRHVENGAQCLAYLRREPPYAGARFPDLLLLDLNMPVMNGFAVLAAIAADEGLRHLPVVILTTSEAEADILQSYRLRASSYIVKPVDFDQFSRVIQMITDYWFTIVALPGDAIKR